MARNYAALPHEYLEEMDILSDAEFGRLCRALLAYSMDGREGRLEGAEKVLWKRVKNQEDRFKESYNELTESRKEAGKRGAAKRWQRIAKDGKAIANDGKNGYTETKTKTETETETNIPPPVGGRDTAPARDPAVAAVMSAYLDKINPTPSERSLAQLEHFAMEMGAECCLRAFDIALDERKTTWGYIRGILSNKHAQGVRCIADRDRVDRQYQNQRQKKPASMRPGADVQPSAEQIRKNADWLDEFLAGQGDTG